MDTTDTVTDHFVAREVPAGTHSCVLAPHLKAAIAADGDGKYGRMFTDLPAQESGDEALVALGQAGSVMDAASLGTSEAESDNPRIPAGWPIFGQFIAHDITADRSLLLHHANFEELRNFRSPRLDLECVYAAGPTGNPYLYDMDDSDKFLIGSNDASLPNDLPRNQQGRALIGDPRNDVHSIISQLHLAVIKFHNRIVDLVREQGTPAADVFDTARRLVTWHYQWIIVHEFLPLNVGQELVDDFLENGPRYYAYEGRPYIPVEFADAAYRFGHSQIRALYQLNATAQGQIFPDCGGTCALPQNRVLEWARFFAVNPAQPPQWSKRIDPAFVHPLIDLPVSVVGETDTPEEHSLAYRDLERARALELPSGEAIARRIGATLLTPAEVDLPGDGASKTPLLFYILKEAQVHHNGEQLGAVGGRIVAEVLLSILEADPRSYRQVDPDWTPVLPGAEPGTFTIADLLRFAGVA